MNPKKAAKARPENTIAGGRIEVKLAGAGATPDGTFSGYGATYEPHPTSAWMLPADWQDVFAPGAFKRTLGEHKARGSRPSMLFMHDFDDVMGVWESIAEDKDGLAMAGRLCIEVQEVADCYALMKMGAIQSLSVGFVPIKVELDEETKTRTILDCDLFEVSIVSVPGNPGALVDEVKAKGGMTAKQMQALKDGVSEIKDHAQAMSETCDTCDHKATIQMADDLLDQLGDKEDEGKARVADPHNIRDLEAALREAGLSRSEAKAVLASGFKSLSPRDADGLAATFEKLKKSLKGA